MVENIKLWIRTAKENGDRYIISVCDTFDYYDYPVYCKDEETLAEERPKYNNVNMQRINEIIDVDNNKYI